MHARRGSQISVPQPGKQVGANVLERLVRIVAPLHHKNLSLCDLLVAEIAVCTAALHLLSLDVATQLLRWQGRNCITADPTHEAILAAKG